MQARFWLEWGCVPGSSDGAGQRSPCGFLTMTERADSQIRGIPPSPLVLWNHELTGERASKSLVSKNL